MKKTILAMAGILVLGWAVVQGQTSTDTATTEQVQIEEYVPRVIIEKKWSSNPEGFMYEMAEGDFISPVDNIFVDDEGNIYVDDANKNEGKKFNKNGKFLSKMSMKTFQSMKEKASSRCVVSWDNPQKELPFKFKGQKGYKVKLREKEQKVVITDSKDKLVKVINAISGEIHSITTDDLDNIYIVGNPVGGSVGGYSIRKLNNQGTEVTTISVRDEHFNFRGMPFIDKKGNIYQAEIIPDKTDPISPDYSSQGGIRIIKWEKRK